MGRVVSGYPVCLIAMVGVPRFEFHLLIFPSCMTLASYLNLSRVSFLKFNTETIIP